MNRKQSTDLCIQQVADAATLARDKIIERTSDPDNFASISEIERIGAALLGDTSLLYSHMNSQLLSGTDESLLIRKKKLNTKPKG